MEAACNVGLQYITWLHIWRLALDHVTITTSNGSHPSMVCKVAPSIKCRLQLTCSQTWQLGGEHQLSPAGCILTAPLLPPGESTPASAHKSVWLVCTSAKGPSVILLYSRDAEDLCGMMLLWVTSELPSRHDCDACV